MNYIPQKLVNILLVEDNPGNVRLTQEVLKEGKIKNKLNVVMDGRKIIMESEPNKGSAFYFTIKPQQVLS